MIDLDLLIDYHYWAMHRMLDAVAGLSPDAYLADRGNSFRSIRDTVVHLYSAEVTWYSRWIGRAMPSPLAPETYPDVAGVRAAWTALEPEVRAHVRSLTPEARAAVFDYHAFTGQPMRSVFWHTAQHLVNHGSYHRGQITTMLRQIGAAPPKSMDMIAYYREHG
jgi:uncharacterized damage-inducible protein DinB